MKNNFRCEKLTNVTKETNFFDILEVCADSSGSSTSVSVCKISREKNDSAELKSNLSNSQNFESSRILLEFSMSILFDFFLLKFIISHHIRIILEVGFEKMFFFFDFRSAKILQWDWWD